MSYVVYTTEPFEKEVAKLEKLDRERIEGLYSQLKDNPFAGDQLQYRNLREKRIREKRVYYLVYEDLGAVLMVAVSGKKDQQETINHIIDYFDEYKEYLEEQIRKGV